MGKSQVQYLKFQPLVYFQTHNKCYFYFSFRFFFSFRSKLKTHFKNRQLNPKIRNWAFCSSSLCSYIDCKNLSYPPPNPLSQFTIMFANYMIVETNNPNLIEDHGPTLLEVNLVVVELWFRRLAQFLTIDRGRS